jgi:DNA-binding NarL/FixJ family response regulator
MIKVLIADDHPIVREGLKQMLSETSDINVSGIAKNSAEVMNELQERQHDVILLDISMPGRGGMDTLRQIRKQTPGIPVLMLTIHPEEQYAIRAIKMGASGYLTKDCEPEELISAIRRLAAGGKYITEKLAERLATDINVDTEKPLHELLSNREFTVLLKIAHGNTVSEIAKEMSLSVKTISTYRVRILRKMNMKNNSELTHYCFKHKLLD